MDKQKYEWEVIIVDDGSLDGSIEFTEKFIKDNTNFRLLKNSHLGKAGQLFGNAQCKRGIRAFYGYGPGNTDRRNRQAFAIPKRLRYCYW